MNINSNSTNKIEYLVKTDNNPHHKVYHVAHGLDALKDYFDDFIIRLVSRSALKTDHKIDQIKARLQNISWEDKVDILSSLFKNQNIINNFNRIDQIRAQVQSEYDVPQTEEHIINNFELDPEKINRIDGLYHEFETLRHKITDIICI
ncbi:MAG: hypothetical protein WAT62_02170 [Candidatus Nanogingivalis sp.]